MTNCQPSEPPVPIVEQPSGGELEVMLGCTDGRFVVPALATRELPEGSETSITSARLQAVAEGLLPREEDAGYAPGWLEPIDLSVQEAGGTVTIDLARGVADQVVSSPGSSNAFFIPLVGTAFLDPSTTTVEITLGGSAEAAAEWWQATELVWDRALWEATFD